MKYVAIEKACSLAIEVGVQPNELLQQNCLN
jgi:hypothetical protein